MSAEAGLIFDIGLDLGQDTDFYLKKGFRVVAVDANPAACAAVARHHAQAIAEGRLTIVNKAISETGDRLTFYVCREYAGQSTADMVLRDALIREGATFDAVEVDATTPLELVLAFGVPYFAKIDIEGFDLVCLRGFARTSGRPEYISTEVDFRRYREQLRCLADLGYRRFALVSQTAAPLQHPPRPALEGCDVDHTFAHHASGLFGRELPEPWLSLGEVMARCRRLRLQYRVSGAIRRLQVGPLAGPIHRARLRLLPVAGDWFDIHATR